MVKVPKFKKKKEQKIKAQLDKDIEDCQREMKPILEKYNLTLGGTLVGYENGIVAMAKLNRPTEPVPQNPPLAQGNTVKPVDVKGEAPGSPAAVSKAMKNKDKS